MISRKKTVAVAAAFLLVAIWSHAAFASDGAVGILDNVLQRYSTAAAKWQDYILGRATFLFWTLAILSMIWTFGKLALRKADLAEFFAEFISFTMFTGFFWWLLSFDGSKGGSSQGLAIDIINSMKSIGGTAGGTPSTLSPSAVVDIGFDIFWKVIDNSRFWSPVSSAVGMVIGLIILIALALVGINMVLLLVSGWILAYAGIIFLGFGGARWTSDMAIGYYRTVLNIGVQLMVMILLIGIGTDIINSYYAAMSSSTDLHEMSVLLVASLVLASLVARVPGLVAGIAGGGTSGIGSIGPGSAIAAAGAVATGGATLVAAGIGNMVGGAQAVSAAVSQAQSNVAAGTDLLAGTLGGVGNSANGAGAGDRGSGSSALASAMGGHAGGGQTWVDRAANVLASGTRTAADAAANLVSGGSNVVKAKASGAISGTFGGQVAAAIKSAGASAPAVPSFAGNSLAGSTDTAVDPEAEIAAFRESK